MTSVAISIDWTKMSIYGVLEYKTVMIRILVSHICVMYD